VIRPLRHRAGEGFRVADTDDYDFRTEYCSELFPKKYEYRVIYCRGVKVATLLKRVPSSLGVLDAWNHSSGCRFVSVLEPDNDRLRHTTAYRDLQNSEVIKNADLVAADIMLAERARGSTEQKYVVAELNFCPSISIDSTFRAIKEVIHG